MCVFAQNVAQFLDAGEAGTNRAGHYLISGTVSAVGHGRLSGACVIVTSSAPGSQPVYSVSRGTGGYSVLGLALGGYEVEFSSGCGATGYMPQWWQDRNSPFGATLVTVTADTTTSGISATLHR